MFQVQNIQILITRTHSHKVLPLQAYSSLLPTRQLYRRILVIILCIGLITPSFAAPNSHYNVSQSPSLGQTYILVSPPHHAHQRLCYESIVSYPKQSSKDPGIFSKKGKKKSSLPKVHPRKKLLEEAPIHTQRAWLRSAIVPGLGQLYNKSYWEIPVIYTVFGLLAWIAIYNHNEYLTSRRELLKKVKEEGAPIAQYPNLANYMDGRKRDRDFLMGAMLLWYLLNVFEAYVGGTLKTFDVSDELEVVIQPDKSSTQNVGIGLNISLQSKNKNENRTHWVW